MHALLVDDVLSLGSRLLEVNVLDQTHAMMIEVYRFLAEMFSD